MDEAALTRLHEASGLVSRETFLDLQEYQSALLHWNRRINLVAESTIAHLWDRHIIDSAQLIRLVPSRACWLDIGSGAGLPGIVTAILLKGKGDGSVTLVESNQKKSAFLRSIAAKLQLPAAIHTRRIEELAGEVGPFDVVTARAVARLDVLLELVAPWLTSGANGLFHKGRDYRNELAICADAWEFDLIEHPSLVESGSVILEISGLRRKS